MARGDPDVELIARLERARPRDWDRILRGWPGGVFLAVFTAAVAVGILAPAWWPKATIRKAGVQRAEQYARWMLVEHQCGGANRTGYCARARVTAVKAHAGSWQLVSGKGTVLKDCTPTGELRGYAGRSTSLDPQYVAEPHGDLPNPVCVAFRLAGSAPPHRRALLGIWMTKNGSSPWSVDHMTFAWSGRASR